MKTNEITPERRTVGRIRLKKPCKFRARKSCPDEQGFKFRTIIDLTDDLHVREYNERVNIGEIVIDLTDVNEVVIDLTD